MPWSFLEFVSSLNFDDLKNLADSEFDWGENPQVHNAVLNRFEQLLIEQDAENIEFGSEAFWNQALGPEPEENSPTFVDNVPDALFDSEEDGPLLDSDDEDGPPLDSDDEEDDPQIGAALNLDDHLEIRTRERIRMRHFKTSATGLELRFRNLDRVNNILELLHRALEAALERAFRDAAPEDKVGVEIIIPALDTPILVPFTTKELMVVENIMNLVEQVIQSNDEVNLADGLLVKTTHIEAPKAGGRNKPPFRSNFNKFMDQKAGGHGRSVIEIQNNDFMCVPRAIVLGICRLEKDDSPEKLKLYNTVLKGDRNRYTKQKTMAMALATQAGINMDAPCSIPEFQKLQAVMKDDYRLAVYDQDKKFAKVYEGPQSRKKIVRLLLKQQHVSLVTSMPALFAKSNYCDQCDKGYNDRGKHKCDNTCPGCFRMPPCPVPTHPSYVDCLQCHRYFTSRQCFDNHKSGWSGEGAKRRKTVPTCDRIIHCLKCGNLKARDHKCGHVKCHICRQEYEKKNDHQCFMPTYTKSAAASKRLGVFIFFDMESIVVEDTVGENKYGDITNHQVNCVCSVKVCRDCVETYDRECDTCGTPDQKIRKFFGDDALADFGQYLFSPQNRYATGLAHNLRSYDGILLMRYLDTQLCEPDVLTKGRQILSMEVDKIRCVDTLNFIPMKLSAMGKAFEIPETKGHFPYFFNRRENYDAVLDQLPDVSFYDPANRSTKERDEIYRWHAAENARLRATGEKWVFRDELTKYCMSDTVLLAKASLKFRNDMLDRTGICPFTEAVTIASACNLHFRKNHLTEGLIGLCPEGGYRRHHKQSMMAVRVLKIMAEEEDLASKDQMIKHCLNGGEVKVAGLRVDGLLCRASTGEDLKEVIEIHGCVWHGCPTCYPRERDKLTPAGISLENAYDRTRVKEGAIMKAGYSLRVLWEHEIREKLRTKPLFKAKYDAITEIQDPLDPRDAFYGGRVGALEMYRKIEKGQKIDYRRRELGKRTEIIAASLRIYENTNPVRTALSFGI